MKRNGVLVVIDGWGYGEDNEHNAFRVSDTPVIDRLMQQNQFTLLGASGEFVGLPKGAVGNSEIGHMTIGAGRRIDYESTRVERASAAGELTDHVTLSIWLSGVRSRGKALHLVGLCSDGMVHSHITHFMPLLLAAKKANIEQVYIHAFADGRDVSDGTAEGHFGKLESMVQEAGIGKIVTVVGRAYAMDRNGDWHLTKGIYDAMTQGIGHAVNDAQEAIRRGREKNLADEWIEPAVIVDDAGVPVGRLQDGDLIVTVNFRGDRMVQLTRSLAQPGFDAFDRGAHPNVELITMTDYSLPFELPILFPKLATDGGLSDHFNDRGIRNVRVAESEKFPHVTYFFNGKSKAEKTLEEHFHIPSPSDKDYTKMPEMSAYQVTDEAIRHIMRPDNPFTLLNLSNADVVGHTGNLQALRKAVETVDICLGRIVEAAAKQGSWVAVVGDHGNAEIMWDKHLDRAHVGHTTNPVPFLLIHPDQHEIKLTDKGSLANVAPTVLQMLGVDRPNMPMESSLIEQKLYRV